jgi:peptide/nickel transport system substrate-binding protein
MIAIFRRSALALLLSCAAIGAPAGSPASAQTNLRIGLAEDPDVLDPSLGRTYVGRIVFASICDKLFDIDAKMNIVPQLALSHETSADGKTVTIKLRPGVKFQDGEALDATAAKYSLDRHLNMKGSFRKSDIGSVESVEVVDPLTIALHLKEPFSPLLAQLTDRAGMMVSPKAAEAAGDKFGLHPVCAGPYKFVERVQQDRIVVEKFTDYWDKNRLFIDRITYLPIVDSTVRLANLRSGGLDMMERVLATDIKTVRDNPKLKLAKAVSLGFTGIMINLGHGPKADNPLGKDMRVRQAFELSIDRDALNQVVFNGEFVPGNQWVSPQNAYYQQAFPIPKRDLAKARALLKEAGVNAPLSLDFLVPNGPENRAVAEVVQSMAAEAGFDLKIRVTEFATSIKQAEDGEYQLYLFGWSGRSDPDGNAFITQLCKAPFNYNGYCDPEVDALHQQARRTNDPTVRKATYEKIAAKVLPAGGFLYLYHPQVLIALSDRLDGYTQMPDGLVRVIGLKLK